MSHHPSAHSGLRKRAEADVNAAEARPGRAYRRTRRSFAEQFRGTYVLVPLLPREEARVIKRLRRADGKDVWALSMVKDGCRLFWRYIHQPGITKRELAAIPMDYRLREVRAPNWLPKGRRQGDD